MFWKGKKVMTHEEGVDLAFDFIGDISLEMGLDQKKEQLGDFLISLRPRGLQEGTGNGVFNTVVRELER